MWSSNLGYSRNNISCLISFKKRVKETDKRVKYILDMKFILYFILEGISKEVFNCLFFDMADTAPIKTETTGEQHRASWTSPYFALES